MFEKRLLTAAIVAALGIGLTACGSGSSSGSSDDVGSGVENPSPSVPETGDGPGTTPEPGSGDNGATVPEPNPQPDPEPQPDPDPQPEPEPEPEPEPDPQPQPDPEPGNGAGDNGGQGPSTGSGSAAADCDLAAFNLQPGTRWHVEYQNRTVMAGKPVSGTQVHDFNVVQRTSFHGHSALELKHVTTVALSGTPAVTNEGWTWQDVVGGNVVELYGHRTSTETMGIQMTTESTYEPAWRDLKFTLRSGETANYTYTMKTVATTNAMGMETQTESSHSASGSWTYHGMESVTVPAGTFNTCKFTNVEDGTTNVEWFLPGQLIIVKSVSDAHDGSGEVRLDLTAGTFNGAALR